MALWMMNKLNAILSSLLRFRCQRSLSYVRLKETVGVRNALILTFFAWTENRFISLHEVGIWVLHWLLLECWLLRLILTSVPRVVVWKLRVSLCLKIEVLSYDFWRILLVWLLVEELFQRILFRCWTNGRLLCRSYVLQSYLIYELVFLKLLNQSIFLLLFFSLYTWLSPGLQSLIITPILHRKLTVNFFWALYLFRTASFHCDISSRRSSMMNLGSLLLILVVRHRCNTISCCFILATTTYWGFSFDSGINNWFGRISRMIRTYNINIIIAYYCLCQILVGFLIVILCLCKISIIAQIFLLIHFQNFTINISFYSLRSDIFKLQLAIGKSTYLSNFKIDRTLFTFFILFNKLTYNFSDNDLKELFINITWYGQLCIR